jgi:hypothetical protein
MNPDKMKREASSSSTETDQIPHRALKAVQNNRSNLRVSQTFKNRDFVNQTIVHKNLQFLSHPLLASDKLIIPVK